MPALLAIKGCSLPSVLPVRLVPAMDRIFVKKQKLCDLGTAFPNIQKQNRIRLPGNPVTLAFAADTTFKFKSLFRG
ncbi:MAG: hypothetical protein ABJL13_17135 [Tateyamaria sp.]